jgi:hypothetical protein
MHNAPSVVYPVGRCAFQAWLLVLLGGVSAAVGVFFLGESNLQSQDPWGWLIRGAGILAWLVWTAWAFLSWTRSMEGFVQWSAERRHEMDRASAWWWSDQSGSASLVLIEMKCVLDLQDRVLLRFCGSSMGPRWVWVERQASPAHWSDLRRALVHSRI